MLNNQINTPIKPNKLIRKVAVRLLNLNMNEITNAKIHGTKKNIAAVLVTKENVLSINDVSTPSNILSN